MYGKSLSNSFWMGKEKCFVQKSPYFQRSPRVKVDIPTGDVIIHDAEYTGGAEVFN